LQAFDGVTLFVFLGPNSGFKLAKGVLGFLPSLLINPHFGAQVIQFSMQAPVQEQHRH
jgi:hypothetical protein